MRGQGQFLNVWHPHHIYVCWLLLLQVHYYVSFFLYHLNLWQFLCLNTGMCESQTKLGLTNWSKTSLNSKQQCVICMWFC